eukprot:snap_masked-scaffold_50-processed-gene-1.79-mRNA-1 protein AED:1.00 eAED:1.00 QI:0/-1/0/0/-1/1/1/0/73
MIAKTNPNKFLMLGSAGNSYFRRLQVLKTGSRFDVSIDILCSRALIETEQTVLVGANFLTPVSAYTIPKNHSK